MIDVPGDGFALRLLDLETCSASGISVGNVQKTFYAWDKKGRLLQTLWIPGRHAIRSVVTHAADGRPTIIASEFLDEHERMRPVHVRAIDLLTGVVRWRRREKLHAGAACFSLGAGGDDAGDAPRRSRVVVRLDAPHGAHLFDVDTGMRLRASDRELTPLATRRRKKAPATFRAPPAELLPIYTLRRDPPGSRPSDDPEDVRVDAARRAFLFGPNAVRVSREAPRGARPHAACSPTVWQLVRELRALEGKPDVSKIPARITEFGVPPEVQALFAADSAFLRARWKIDLKLLPTVEAEAVERRVPAPVVAIGGEAFPENPQRPKLLCAQTTDFGARLGTFDGFGYQGPFPIETFLSDACWSLLEGRSPDEQSGDVQCAQMEPCIRRVLEAPPDPAPPEPPDGQ